MNRCSCAAHPWSPCDWCEARIVAAQLDRDDPGYDPGDADREADRTASGAR